MRTVLQAVAVSEYMEEVLARQRGDWGRVRSVHARRVNVILPGDELLSIQSEEWIRSPLSLVVQWPGEAEPALSPNDGLRLNRLLKTLQAGLWEIPLNGMSVFKTRTRIWPRPQCREALWTLEQHFAGAGARGSVFDFIGATAVAEQDGSRQAKTYGDMLRRKTGALAQAFQSGDASAAAGAAIKLVGFGPGLTPAGDDFLQGFLLLTHAHRGFERLSEACCNFLQGQRLDTGEISRAFWRSFLAGHTVEPVKNFADAFNTGDWEAFALQAEEISRMGHTSGDDWLTGAWFALKLSETEQWI